MKYVNAVLGLGACLLLGWLVYQQSLESTKTVAETKTPPTIAVEVMRVQTRTVEDRIDVVGSLEANAAVEIRSRVNGYIKRLPFDLGDYVKAGDLVVELDDSEYREAVSRAEAALKVAKAQLEANEAKAKLAQDEVRRLEELSATGVSTPQQLDQARAQLAIAVSELELGKAQVDQAESDRLQSQLRLKDTQITAPFSGFLAARLVETGDLAQPNLPLLRIADLTIVRTVVYVVERDYERVKPGQQAQIQVDAFPNEWFVGTVTRKAPVVDADTRTAAVVLEVRNPDGKLKPGMHARVRLVFDKHRDAEVVPIAAVFQQDGRSMVYLVEGTPPQTILRPVLTGVSDGEMVEILSGVDTNDRVVTLGSRLVADGQTVKAIEVPWTGIGEEPSSMTAFQDIGD